MINIKRFIEKVSYTESKNSKDVVLPILEARGLRDELAKLLVDLHENNKIQEQPVIEVEIKGGTFK